MWYSDIQEKALLFLIDWKRMLNPNSCVSSIWWSWSMTMQMSWSFCFNFVQSFLILSYFLFLPSLDRRVTQVRWLFSLKSHSKRVKTTEQPLNVPSLSLYPIRLSANPYRIPSCDSSPSNATYLQGDFSSSAEFFVCVGVFGFLYCTATLILYLGYQNVYRQTTRGPIIVSMRPVVSNKLSSCLLY